MNEAKQRKIEARRMTLLDIIRKNELGIGDLATKMDVSANTIRKDLDALQEAGHSMSINGVVKLAQ
jgi:DeoR/GlpR family transcriptional regulator of sugar metabolism